MLSRRDFHKLALAAVPVSLAAAKPNSKIHGVQIGAQSYSFRDRSLDEAIKGMVEVGLSECELWMGHVEPKKNGGREALREWRTTVSMDHFKEVRKKFDDAGILLYAYNYSFRDDFTDAEIERGFEMAHALGVTRLTASSTVPCAKRIDPFAAKHKVYVGMHGHDSTKPGEFASPKSFEEAMAGASKYIAINLDIGHFTAAGYDAVAYLEKMHDRIVTLHIKDRKKNVGETRGANLPLGEGDTPIKPVLNLLKTKKWPIPANIEYEYKGADTLAEVKKCYEYCKAALA
ncbi:MAG TPA: TIM barrel protein [Bryobacteraceae bacterium]|nr:TIM barrel protein [Bryobacteraceae bacterium]